MCFPSQNLKRAFQSPVIVGTRTAPFDNSWISTLAVSKSEQAESSEAIVFPPAEQKGSCWQLFCTTLPHGPCILDSMGGGKKATRYSSPKKQITFSHQLPGVLLNGTL